MTNMFKPWKGKDIQFVRKHISLMTDRQFADHFGRSEKAIKSFRKRMKIFRDADGRFKSGHTPANKGISYQAGGRSAETRFKKGSKPHNTKQDHAISTRVNKTGRPYQFIRIGMGHWIHLHRYIWELTYGPIPKNMLCVFRDGNSMNINPENLELITRAENARRNQNSAKASISMQKHWNYCRRKEHAGLITARHQQLNNQGIIR